MMHFPAKWPDVKEEYLRALAEFNPNASGTKIAEMMSQCFDERISISTVNQKLRAIRGMRKYYPTDKEKDEFFEFVAKNCHLQWSEIARLYSEKSGIKMNADMCRRWYRSTLNKSA